MADKKVWMITGAGRGMGVDCAKAALAAGHKVVATGRNTDKVAQAVGESADLLVVKLDVTKPADAPVPAGPCAPTIGAAGSCHRRLCARNQLYRSCPP
jgi:NAD(P)-dependent dehydrogenase (short-subunit alcohol dehydrogenase family)